jgi:tRNA(Arg) A34 adenosine deaminase TadA
MLWETLSEPWRACIEEAWTAYCFDSLPIGAVVTDASGRILSRGRNRIYEDTAEIPCLYNHTLAHAEMNALLSFDHRQNDPRQGCILYTTTEPCPMCFGAFYMSGIRELRYASREPYAGSVNLLGTTPYMGRKPIRIIHPPWAELEIILVAMSTEALLSWGAKPGNTVLDSHERVLPQAVQLGKSLHQSGQLRRLRDQKAAAYKVVNHLAHI